MDGSKNEDLQIIFTYVKQTAKSAEISLYVYGMSMHLYLSYASHGHWRGCDDQQYVLSLI